MQSTAKMLAMDLINAIANTADFKQVPDTDVMDGIVKPWLDLQDANVAKSLDSIQQKHQQIADTHHGFEKNLPKAYQPLVVALRKGSPKSVVAGLFWIDCSSVRLTRPNQS